MQSHAVMSRPLPLIVLVMVASYLAGCDGGDRPSASPSPQRFTDRLLSNLEARDSWPANTVKIALDQPVLVVELPTLLRPTTVYAWPAKDNDYNVAMFQIVGDDTLYALTDDEYGVLAVRAQNQRNDPNAPRIEYLLTGGPPPGGLVGEIVTVRGEVSSTKIPQIHGVDVRSDDPDLRGEMAEATGVLERWTVTEKDLEGADFAHRGPGVFYRLKDPNSNQDAQVQRVPDTPSDDAAGAPSPSG